MKAVYRTTARGRFKKRFKERINGQLKQELIESGFYPEFKSNLEKCLKSLDGRQIEQMICYGLGSFVNGFSMVAARYQLALTLLLYEELVQQGCPLASDIEIYDPLFDNDDKDVLTSFTCPKFTLIEKNEHCARKVTTSGDNRCVLVFMPHLDNEFYNNLLGANWDADSLSKLVILGNDLALLYNDPFHAKKLKTKFHYVYHLLNNFSEFTKKKRKRVATDSDIGTNNSPNGKALIQVPLRENFDELAFGGAFSDLVYHLVNISWLKDNAQKIDRSRLKDWKCDVITSYDHLFGDE